MKILLNLLSKLWTTMMFYTTSPRSWPQKFSPGDQTATATQTKAQLTRAGMTAGTTKGATTGQGTTREAFTPKGDEERALLIMEIMVETVEEIDQGALEEVTSPIQLQLRTRLNACRPYSRLLRLRVLRVTAAAQSASRRWSIQVGV